MRLCVSPGWLKDNRAPTRVSDLATSPCISFSPTLGPEREATWPISDGEGAEEVRVSWPVRADSGLALSAAVLGGAGIGLLPGFLVRGFLADGRLVELLPHARTRTYRV
jgi:DNA-binding transcriptional LysR family regulator